MYIIVSRANVDLLRKNKKELIRVREDPRKRCPRTLF